MSAKWQASLKAEHRKLASTENDWNLKGNGLLCLTRTRHNGHGRPKFPQCPEVEMDTAIIVASSSSSDEEWSLSGMTTDSDSTTEEVKKPSATRLIVDAEGMKKTLMDNVTCKVCGGSVEVSFPTTCLATKITLYCRNARCGFMYCSPPPVQVAMPSEDKRERSTDYSINVLYVLGFMAAGDGATEAARLLGLLGLPNDTTMESRSFTLIESQISPAIQEVTKELLLENLVAEAKLAMTNDSNQDDNDFRLWTQWIEHRSFALMKPKYPKLTVSFDMGWQQRSSGIRYNSQSGHALLVGGLTRKPICMAIKSKRCVFCNTWKANNKDVVEAAELDGEDLLIPFHECTKNHVGSSSSMEPEACLEMVVDLFDNYCCIIQSICCDDDASTRALLKWSNNDWMANNNTTVGPRVLITGGKKQGKTKPRESTGRLPAHIPEPSFVADPNHRRKLLMKELIAVTKLPVAKRHTMTTMDCTRIEKNFSYMIRQLTKMPQEQYETAGKAVLRHHFDSHEYCFAWCKRKGLSEEDRKLPQNKRFYRSLTKDKDLYELLSPIVDRFITFDRLTEVAHGMDTQCNESYNNTFSWIAPKNKVYCGSQSLRNRLSIGVGINILGHLEYFTRLYRKLGIIITPNVQHYLAKKETRRTKRIKKRQQVDVKRDRRRQKYAKQKKDESKATLECEKREGKVYRTGMNMEDVVDDEEQQGTNQQRRKTPIKCPFCGKKNHKTKKSMHCLQNPNYLARIAAADAPATVQATTAQAAPLIAQENDDSEVEEIDDLDRLQITNDDSTSTSNDVQAVGIMRATL
jgi:hypothetical protein